MKRFLAFIIKEFRHLLRDFRTVLIIFGIPVVQLLLFGHVISTEIKNAEIGILDFSKDNMSIKLTNKLLSSGYFNIRENIGSIKETEALFKKGKIKELIVIEYGFSEKLVKYGGAQIQLITDASDPNNAAILESYTKAIIMDFTRELYSTKITPIIQTEHRMYYNEQLRSANMFVPGTIALILMLISALMTSISIARERELGTMEILLVSPLRPVQIIMGKVIPYLVLAFLNSIIIVGVGYFVFHVPVNGSVILLFTLCLMFILLALALGITISTFVKTQQAAMIVSLVGLMLPTILLSGFIFPIDNMPKILQYISILMPPRWFLSAIKDIMLKGVGVLYIWKEILILSIMMVGFVVISIRKFQVRLE